MAFRRCFPLVLLTLVRTFNADDCSEGISMLQSALTADAEVAEADSDSMSQSALTADAEAAEADSDSMLQPALTADAEVAEAPDIEQYCRFACEPVELEPLSTDQLDRFYSMWFDECYQHGKNQPLDWCHHFHHLGARKVSVFADGHRICNAACMYMASRLKPINPSQKPNKKSKDRK